MKTKTPTRSSSRTAADLKELDQQFKGWMKILTGDLGVRSLKHSSDVMMVGDDPYGISIIEDYHNLPKGSTITVEMMDVSENMAFVVHEGDVQGVLGQAGGLAQHG